MHYLQIEKPTLIFTLNFIRVIADGKKTRVIWFYSRFFSFVFHIFFILPSFSLFHLLLPLPITSRTSIFSSIHISSTKLSINYVRHVRLAGTTRILGLIWNGIKMDAKMATVKLLLKVSASCGCGLDCVCGCIMFVWLLFVLQTQRLFSFNSYFIFLNLYNCILNK